MTVSNGKICHPSDEPLSVGSVTIYKKMPNDPHLSEEAFINYCLNIYNLRKEMEAPSAPKLGNTPIAGGYVQIRQCASRSDSSSVRIQAAVCQKHLNASKVSKLRSGG